MSENEQNLEKSDSPDNPEKPEKLKHTTNYLVCVKALYEILDPDDFVLVEFGGDDYLVCAQDGQLVTAKLTPEQYEEITSAIEEMEFEEGLEEPESEGWREEDEGWKEGDGEEWKRN